jgi:hypothetical protein
VKPEAIDRERIDAMLHASGWQIQDYKALNLSYGLGVAIREVPLKSGPCDYLLLVNRLRVGVIEAKKKAEKAAGKPAVSSPKSLSPTRGASSTRVRFRRHVRLVRHQNCVPQSKPYAR